MARRVAIIDIGSNSVRMHIYERSSRFAFRVIYETKSAIRLSEGAFKNGGILQELPMQRAKMALMEFLEIIKSFKARKTLCVATSALRDAPNRAEFISSIREIGLNIKVIDGLKEAYLGGISCINLLPKYQDAISIDIGGGSSEFVHIQNGNIKTYTSLNLGTTRLKELFDDDINLAKKHIDSELQKLNLNQSETLIGIGGSFRALANIILKKTSYPLNKLHGYEPSFKKFYTLLEKIVNSNNVDELKKLGIKESRIQTIKSGALILLRVIKKFNIQKVIASGAGVREGVFLKDTIRGEKLPLNFNPSIRYISDTSIYNHHFNNNLKNISSKLYDLLNQKLNLNSEFKTALLYATKIFDAKQDTLNMLNYALTHQEIALIYALSSKNELNSINLEPLLPLKKVLQNLKYIISLAEALLAHMPRSIDFKLEFIQDTLFVKSTKNLYLSKEATNQLQGYEGIKIEYC